MFVFTLIAVLLGTAAFQAGPSTPFTSELLVGMASALLSLGFTYAPGLKDWFEAQDGQAKSLVSLVAITVAAVGVFLMSCYTPRVWVECSGTGFWGLVEIWGISLMSNQGTYLVTRRLRK